MNSSPAAYAAADPKFPPSEEYSQGNYIPDYYGASAQQAVANAPNTHQSHYGYHHHAAALNYIDQSQQPYHHHHHNHHVGPPTGPPQYYTPCTAGGMGPGGAGVSPHGPIHHTIAAPHQISPHQSSIAPQLSHLSRVSSPSGLHRSPSPRTQAALSIVEPPSPPDCGISGQSGSDSGNGGGGGGGHPVIYPWMKKVHVNQGNCKGKHMFNSLAVLLYCFNVCISNITQYILSHK